MLEETKIVDFSLFDYVPYGVFVLNPDFEVVFWNNALSQFSMITQGEVLHKNIFAFFPHLATPMYQKRFAQLFEHKIPAIFSAQLHRYLIPCPLPNGEYRIQQTFANIVETSEENFAIFTLQDLTEEEKKAQQYKILKNKAEQMAKAKSDFLSVISHEIRTPLNAIVGIAHLLSQEISQTTQSKNLESLHHSAEYLLSLVSDILEYNKIEVGSIQIQQDYFDLATLVENMQRLFAAKALNKKLAFSIEVPSKVPLLKGDALRIEQVLNNLVSNALKFTEKGFVKVVIKEEGRNTDKIFLRFEVQDTGIGISVEEQQRIFNHFVQANPHIMQKYGGSGLGLAICKSLLNMMNSDISLTSVVGEGSIFAFNLALAYEADAMLLEEKALVMLPERLQGMSILLAEDNEINRMVAVQFLERWGASVTTCQDGRIALNVFAQNPQAYDLILMDLQMPELSGYAAAEAIRSLSNVWAKKIPIVALSASDSIQKTMGHWSINFNDFVSKPFHPEKLYETIVRFHKQLKGENTSSTAKNVDITHYLTLAHDDTNFLERLFAKIIEEFGKAVQEYTVFFETKNLEGIRNLHHRLNPTFELLKISRVQNLMEMGKKLVQKPMLDTLEKQKHLAELNAAMAEVLADIEKVADSIRS